jgi:glutamine cyclotransferase
MKSLYIVFAAMLLCTQAQIVSFSATVIDSFDHDYNDFTQGLFFESDDIMVESTGIYGESVLQRVRLSTGEKLLVVPLPDSYFGEGCEALNGKIYQLTWREHTMFVYD